VFLTLLALTFVVAATTSSSAALLFRGAIHKILARLVGLELADAWRRYLMFAVFVVGLSSGVRIWELEKYITPRSKEVELVVLNTDRWVLEVCRTVIESLQGIACVLLAFFSVALVAYVIVRAFELRGARVAPEAMPQAQR
jgi:hypothetical protein